MGTDSVWRRVCVRCLGSPDRPTECIGNMGRGFCSGIGGRLLQESLHSLAQRRDPVGMKTTNWLVLGVGGWSEQIDANYQTLEVSHNFIVTADPIDIVHLQIG